MNVADLGIFAQGFEAWRRILETVPQEAQLRVFGNAVEEVAIFIARGLDRVVAADELTEMAAVVGFEPDQAQSVIAHAFEKVARPAASANDYGKYEKINGQRTAAIPLAFPFPIDVAAIPRRPWIVPGLLLRRHVTLLIAPPGSGKSLLTLQIAMMCAAPLVSWAGWRPRERSRVLIINSEEDGDELRRRLAAAAEVMAINSEDLKETIAYAEAPGDIVIAKADNRTKTVTRMPMIDQIVETIKTQAIDILIIDPFAETFVGDENNNSELKWAAVLWREVARATNCAVLLVHHAKKYSSDMAGDMDASRGGGSLAGVARIVCTLFAMTDLEAMELLGADNTERRTRYLRFDDAKANLTLLTPAARWFEKLSCRVGNGEDHEGDEVGVLQPWKPPSAFDNMSTPQAIAILDEIQRGVIGDDGQPTGDYFLIWRRGSKPRFWAGDIVQRTLGCTEKEAKNILKQWLSNRVIETFTAQTPQTKRHSSDGNIRVVLANRPGVISQDLL